MWLFDNPQIPLWLYCGVIVVWVHRFLVAMSNCAQLIEANSGRFSYTVVGEERQRQMQTGLDTLLDAAGFIL